MSAQTRHLPTVCSRAYTLGARIDGLVSGDAQEFVTLSVAGNATVRGVLTLGSMLDVESFVHNTRDDLDAVQSLVNVKANELVVAGDGIVYVHNGAAKVATRAYTDRIRLDILGDANLGAQRLDTLSEIANAIHGDASIGNAVYSRIDTVDNSIALLEAASRAHAANGALTSSIISGQQSLSSANVLGVLRAGTIGDVELAIRSTNANVALVDVALSAALSNISTHVDASIAALGAEDTILKANVAALRAADVLLETSVASLDANVAALRAADVLLEASVASLDANVAALRDAYESNVGIQENRDAVLSSAVEQIVLDLVHIRANVAADAQIIHAVLDGNVSLDALRVVGNVVFESNIVSIQGEIVANRAFVDLIADAEWCNK